MFSPLLHIALLSSIGTTLQLTQNVGNSHLLCTSRATVVHSVGIAIIYKFINNAYKVGNQAVNEAVEARNLLC